jgi:hypothetical protein
MRPIEPDCTQLHLIEPKNEEKHMKNEKPVIEAMSLFSLLPSAFVLLPFLRAPPFRDQNAGTVDD